MATLAHENGLEPFDDSIGGYADSEKNVDRPDEMPTKADCDVVVSTSGELTEEIQKDGNTIYLDENTGEILYKGPQNIYMGRNVTIVGQYCDPDFDGIGTYIKQDYYHRDLFISNYGSPPTLWGVPMIGPMVGNPSEPRSFEEVYFDPRSDERTNNGELDPSAWYATGIHCYDPKDSGELFVYGCLFMGWSVAGMEIGARDYETQATIDRCSFVLNAMETLGYGVSGYNGHQWYNRCYFDGNRHAVTAYGYVTHSYEVTRSVSGPSMVAGHVFDMHDRVEPNRGGKHVRIDSCSNYTIDDISGDEQEFFAQRGVSVEMTWVRRCATIHSGPQPVPGDQGDFCRQEEPEDRDQWENFDVSACTFGDPVARDSPHGAPLSPRVKSQPSSSSSSMTLKLMGSGGWDAYSFTVEGAVSPGELVEGGAHVTENDDGTVTIHGTIAGGTDTFTLSADARLRRGYVTGPITVTLDGRVIDMLPLIASEMVYRTTTQDTAADETAAIAQIHDRLSAIETTMRNHSEAISALADRIDTLRDHTHSARIVFGRGK